MHSIISNIVLYFIYIRFSYLFEFVLLSLLQKNIKKEKVRADCVGPITAPQRED